MLGSVHPTARTARHLNKDEFQLLYALAAINWPKVKQDLIIIPSICEAPKTSRAGLSLTKNDLFLGNSYMGQTREP